jgi:hypothetical protein
MQTYFSHPEGVEQNPAIAIVPKMTLKWIAERLKMGTWPHVTNPLSQLKQQSQAALCQ